MSVDAVRNAYEALVRADVEPLVALVDPSMVWRGRRRFPRFWEPRPA
jgi:hypothetical protein